MDRYLEYALYTADTDKVTNYLSSERADKASRKSEAVEKFVMELKNQDALYDTFGNLGV